MITTVTDVVDKKVVLRNYAIVRSKTTRKKMCQEEKGNKEKSSVRLRVPLLNIDTTTGKCRDLRKHDAEKDCIQWYLKVCELSRIFYVSV